MGRIYSYYVVDIFELFKYSLKEQFGFVYINNTVCIVPCRKYS